MWLVWHNYIFFLQSKKLRKRNLRKRKSKWVHIEKVQKSNRYEEFPLCPCTKMVNCMLALISSLICFTISKWTLVPWCPFWWCYLVILGTIHILRKHYIAQNLIWLPNFSQEMFCFCQNKRMYFSTLYFDKIFMLQLGFFSKIEKILKCSLDSIPLPSPSLKIQIMGGKVSLRYKG